MSHALQFCYSRVLSNILGKAFCENLKENQCYIYRAYIDLITKDLDSLFCSTILTSMWRFSSQVFTGKFSQKTCIYPTFSSAYLNFSGRQLLRLADRSLFLCLYDPRVLFNQLTRQGGFKFCIYAFIYLMPSRDVIY